MTATDPIAPFDPNGELPLGGGDYLKTHPMPPGPRPTEEEWRDIAAGVHAARKLDTGFDPDTDPHGEPIPGRDAERVEFAAGDAAKCRDAGWPEALVIAATGEPGEHAAFVTDLGVVFFTSAEIAGPGWVRLFVDAGRTWEANPEFPYAFGEGLEVRLSQILWVANQPARGRRRP
jgi:hypothetical protein